MASAVTSIYNYVISAASAGFAPTNSADVSSIASAYAESAASGKLDNSASSSFYPSDNPSGFISSVDLSDYATTAYVDSSVSGKLDTTAQVVTSIGVAAGALSSINGYGLSAGLANSASTALYDSAGRPLTSFVTSGALPVYGLDPTDTYITSIDTMPLSAEFDSATCSAIASAYAESAASSKLDNSASSSFYPVDNPSGFISSVDLSDYATTAYVDSSISGFAYESAVSGWTAKQDALTYGYNAANQISSIDGSALGGMDEAAVSGIASAYAESAVSSVSGNYYTTANESGYLTAQVQASWSESASASPSYIQDKPDLVDIVAGPGIHIDNPDGNTLRVSMAADYETLLWSGEGVGSSFPITLNESITNFDRVRLYAKWHPTIAAAYQAFEYLVSSDSDIWQGMCAAVNGSSFYQTFFTLTVSSGSSVAYTNGRLRGNYSVGQTNEKQATFCKIVGINRTASAQ